LSRELHSTRTFERLYNRFPKQIQDEAIEKLDLYIRDPSHPSLRVKRMRGTERIWELSVTMQYRVTFEIDDEKIILRRIGTHDILKKP
jgi:mRNA interferase RelE/StbE